MPSHPSVFLSGESRQVWALRRDSGEPFYLEVGQAAAQRAFAKEHLRCPYPGCEAPISTRGGSKRDHFFHVSTTPHETGRESEFHLAAKAMLAQWLRERLPEGATAREEQTVKDPKTSIHRRPDVLATGRTGRQMAFEIEYKPWAIEGWEAKQVDLDAVGLPCLWLFGHTRVRPPRHSYGAENEVVVPALIAAVAQRGLPVLLVNPVTREIGTLTNRAATALYDGSESLAWLQVAALDECSFSSIMGIRTPAMLPIEEAARERARIEADRDGQRRSWEAAWLASPARAACLERWAEVPEEFGSETGAGAWDGTLARIGAVDAHWAAVIYEDLILGRTAAFGWPQALLALKRHGIEARKSMVDIALHQWLVGLDRLGVITMTSKRRDRSPYYLLWQFTPTGMTLEQCRQMRDEEHRRKAAVAAAKEARERSRAAATEARRLTTLVTLPDGRQRYVRK